MSVLFFLTAIGLKLRETKYKRKFYETRQIQSEYKLGLNKLAVCKVWRCRVMTKYFVSNMCQVSPTDYSHIPYV